jgi:hypothetical protein
MGVLLVKCPKTGKMFSTGIEADAETIKNLPEVHTRSRCCCRMPWTDEWRRTWAFYL